MRLEVAIDMARDVLVWLSGEPDALGAFLGASGLAPSDLRERAADPEFLGFLLDFLLGDEALLLSYCRDTGTPPTAPMRARALLPGGDAPNWT